MRHASLKTEASWRNFLCWLALRLPGLQKLVFGGPKYYDENVVSVMNSRSHLSSWQIALKGLRGSCKWMIVCQIKGLAGDRKLWS